MTGGAILDTMLWDPDQYLRYASERALPFHHLVAAVDHLEPATIVDLGCGSGGLTATLLERWPAARIIGVDTSEEMIEHARRRAGRRCFRSGGHLLSQRREKGNTYRPTVWYAAFWGFCAAYLHPE